MSLQVALVFTESANEYIACLALRERVATWHRLPPSVRDALMNLANDATSRYPLARSSHSIAEGWARRGGAWRRGSPERRTTQRVQFPAALAPGGGVEEFDGV